MTYKIDLKNTGRVFTVPCSVVDNYLKDIDGDYLKILLYVISFANCDLDSKNICSACGVKEITVRNAIEYWEKCNVLTCKITNDDFVGFTPISEKNEISNKAILNYNEETKRNNSVNYDPTYISNAIKSSSDLKDFFDEVENVLGRTLRYNDQCAYMYIYEEYGYSPASILLIIDYCKNINNVAPNFVKKIAKDWFSQDIISFEDIERHIIFLHEYNSYESQIKRMLEINIKLSKKQKSYVEDWNDKKISPELVLLAYDRTVENTGKVAFGYMNKIIDSWYKNGIKTVEQAENEKYVPKKNNKKAHSYDLKEIDEFGMNFLMNRKKKKNEVE